MVQLTQADGKPYLLSPPEGRPNKPRDEFPFTALRVDGRWWVMNLPPMRKACVRAAWATVILEHVRLSLVEPGTPAWAGRSGLESDRQHSLALVRLLEIVGEAASRVTTDLRTGHVPWTDIVGLPNRSIHG